MRFKEWLKLELAGAVGATVAGGSGQGPNDGSYRKNYRAKGKIKSKYVTPDEIEDTEKRKIDDKPYLAEMPLNKYSIGDFTHEPEKDIKDIDLSPYFNQRDRKAIKNPLVEKKLAKVLQINTGYNFNIIFLERGGGSKDLNYLGKAEYIREVRAYCVRNGIPLEGYITFAKNGSTGDPLTPWMILHTIGHALIQQLDVPVRAIFIDIADLLLKIDSRTMDENKLLKILASVFEFKSVSHVGFNGKNKTLDIMELICELVAEYLWHGKIRYKIKPVQELVKKIETKIDEALRSCIGKIIVDFLIP